MEVDEEVIQARIKLLKKQRLDFLMQAERQVAMIDGRIAELEELLESPEEIEK